MSARTAAEVEAKGRGILELVPDVQRVLLAPLEAPDAGADAIRRAFEGYAAASEGRFRGALTNAVRAHEIDAAADAVELAAFFRLALIGVAACVRAEAPPQQVRAACKVATAVLDENSTVR